MSTLNSIENTTMFIASHKPAVLSLCDKVLVMENGKIIATKTPQELFTPPKRKVRSVNISPKTTTTRTKDNNSLNQSSINQNSINQKSSKKDINE